MSSKSSSQKRFKRSFASDTPVGPPESFHEQENDLQLEFKRMSEVDNAEHIALNLNPLVHRQMPLTDDNFGEKECQEWVASKEKQWDEHGYGPWAFIIDDKFAGWGGLQYENGDADLGLVLHPDYWGTGKVIYEEIIRRAFGEMKLESVTILFPPTRTRIKGILRLGFQEDGEMEIEGEHFIRYRLLASKSEQSVNEPFLCGTIGIFSNPPPNTAPLAARQSPRLADNWSPMYLLNLTGNSWDLHR